MGNKMATAVMQLMGCDVAALNTVHFSKLAYIIYVITLLTDSR